MGFTFNGISSKNMGIKARLTAFSVIPNLRSNTETIPGKSGIVDLGAEYGERNISVSCCIFPKHDVSALIDTLDGLAAWLDPAAGIKKLLLDDMPDRFFYARLSSNVDFERVVRFGGTFELRFICPDPFGYAVNDDVFNIAEPDSTAYITRTFGNADSKPIYTLYGAIPSDSESRIRIATNGSTLDICGALDDGKALEINSEKMTARILNANKSVYGNGLPILSNMNFPVLKAGRNTILITANGSAVFSNLEIKANSRSR